jgi:hypothetical protein
MVPRRAVGAELWAVASLALPMKPFAPLPLRGAAADGGGIGHHLLHLAPAQCRASIARKATCGSSRHIW